MQALTNPKNPGIVTKPHSIHITIKNFRHYKRNHLNTPPQTQAYKLTLQKALTCSLQKRNKMQIPQIKPYAHKLMSYL
eukprot:gene3021-2003_t